MTNCIKLGYNSADHNNNRLWKSLVLKMNNQYITKKLKEFLPENPEKIFEPINICIYCGSNHNLSDEHIIPFGLGGRMKLPKSSCSACAKITSSFEHTCLRTMYGPLRLMYDLPSRRKNNRPEKLPLKVKIKPTDEWTYIKVEQERYPFLVTFPLYPLPKLLSKDKNSAIRSAATDRLWIRGASPSYNFKDLLQELIEELKVSELMPESHAHMEEFCQMLSKIAYSFAIAVGGYNKFKPFLISHIKDRILTNCGDYIGCSPRNEISTNCLHEISICNQIHGNYVIVRLRLLAKLGTPTYYVVVGEKNKN